MAWIESHQLLGRHPKTKALARALGVSRVTAVGHLQFLWWWALDFAEDGDLSRFADDEIAEEALWEGDPHVFIAALHTAGFINANGSIHDWADYTGRIVAQRESNRDRQRRFRDKGKTPSNGGTSPQTTPVNRDVTVTSPLRNGATVPNQTVPNPTRVNPPSPLPAAAPEPDQPAAAPPSSGPPNEPWQLFAAFCEAVGAEPTAASAREKGKQLKLARSLLDDGFAIADVVACTGYLRSQSWRTGLIDLGTVTSEISKWHMNGRPQRAPTPANRGPGPNGRAPNPTETWDAIIRGDAP